MSAVLRAKIRRRVNAKLSGFAETAAALSPVQNFRDKIYNQEIANYRSQLPALGGVSKRVLADLDLGGVARAPLQEFEIPGASDIISLGQRLVVQETARFKAQAAAGNKFILMQPSLVVQNPQLFLFGLNSVFLDIAEAYIGLPVGFDGVTIQYTFADGEAVSTRDWHRDREDRKMLKVILYLNDVDSSGGPFQLLPRKIDNDREQRYQYLFSPQEQAAMLDGSLGKPVDCEGPTGTVTFADTARFFHRGKPAVGRDRSAIFFSYFAQNPQSPFYCDRSGIPRRDVSRLVKDLPPRQRKAALWQNTLALPWRLIPAASVL